MDEDFQFDIGLGGDFANIFQTQFASQDDTATAQRRGQFGPFGAGDRHLRAAVDVQIWRDLFGQFNDADILNDDGVDTCCCDCQ